MANKNYIIQVGPAYAATTYYGVQSLHFTYSNTVLLVNTFTDANKVIVYPSFASNQKVHYYSYDNSIAQINSNGRITGITEGRTLLYAYSDEDPTIMARTAVAVQFRDATVEWGNIYGDIEDQLDLSVKFDEQYEAVSYLINTSYNDLFAYETENATYFNNAYSYTTDWINSLSNEIDSYYLKINDIDNYREDLSSYVKFSDITTYIDEDELAEALEPYAKADDYVDTAGENHMYAPLTTTGVNLSSNAENSVTFINYDENKDTVYFESPLSTVSLTFKDDDDTIVLNSDLSDYVTNDSLQDTLSDYVTYTYLNDNYITYGYLQTSLTNFDLSAYVKYSYLNNYVSNDTFKLTVSNLVKYEDLSQYLKLSDFNNLYVSNTALNNILASYVTKKEFNTAVDDIQDSITVVDDRVSDIEEQHEIDVTAISYVLNNLNKHIEDIEQGVIYNPFMEDINAMAYILNNLNTRLEAIEKTLLDNAITITVTKTEDKQQNNNNSGANTNVTPTTPVDNTGEDSTSTSDTDGSAENMGDADSDNTSTNDSTDAIDGGDALDINSIIQGI